MEKILYYLFACSIVDISSATNPLARILGGKTVDIKDYPYQVSITWITKDPKQPLNHFCGGAIINKNHILSAAHCFVMMDSDDSSEPRTVKPEEIAVHTGTSRLDNEGNAYGVMSITNHPDYVVTDDANDIAILKLVKSIPIVDTQKPIDLPSHNVKNGSVGTVTGWGDTTWSYDTHSLAIDLQKVSLIVLDKEGCEHTDSKETLGLRIKDTEFCAYSTDQISSSEFTGICSGDDGGPLVVENELVGIVPPSTYHKCGAGVPDIYTNVYSYLDFIKKNSMD